MRPDILQSKIYDWFERRYPDVGSWTNPGFHCYQDAPLELRVVLMTNRVEADLGNGGLPQLLWNCFYHWRVVLRDAAAGYRLFGAVEQEAAIVEFQRLFERSELACGARVEECVRTQDFALFSQWCVSAQPELDSPLESLFYDAADTKRKAWLRLNEEQLLRLMREGR
jgi:hypothetical protein